MWWIPRLSLKLALAFGLFHSCVRDYYYLVSHSLFWLMTLIGRGFFFLQRNESFVECYHIYRFFLVLDYLRTSNILIIEICQIRVSFQVTRFLKNRNLKLKRYYYYYWLFSMKPIFVSSFDFVTFSPFISFDLLVIMMWFIYARCWANYTFSHSWLF